MPTYTYKCKNCGHIIEAFQGISEASLTSCTECSKEALERVLLSAPSFKLKGGGWYKTDYPKETVANTKADNTTAGKSTDNE